MYEIEDHSIELINKYKCEEDSLEFCIDYPEGTLATELIAFFTNCTLSARITSGSQVQDMALFPGSNRLEFHDNSDSIKVELYIDALQDANIDHMSISFVAMNAMPVSIDDVIIKNKPAQGYAVSIDFEHAIGIAQGFEECNEIEVQIADPSNHIINIKNNTSNFKWKGQELFCVLPVAIKHRIRVRYSTGLGWIDWSDWKQFVCKRKMTL